MGKSAKTLHEIHSLLANRYSTRAFSLKEVEATKLDKIMEAARWAPSASNEQPWRFVIGLKGKDSKYDKIFDSLSEFNQLWNKNVPVLILICAYRISSRTGQENPYRFYDAGQAAAMMSIQAVSEELFTHQMAGFDKEKIKESLSLPEGIDPFVVMAVGYQGELQSLHEKIYKLEIEERSRKSPAEIILDIQG